MRKFLFVLIYLMAAPAWAACGAPRVLLAEDPQGFAKLTKVLEAIAPESFESPLPQPLSEMLAMMHPRLVDTAGDCQLKIDDYVLQSLPPIDADMLYAILEKIPRDNRAGFSVLSPNFWLAVQKAQQSGLQVAWIVQSPRVVNGVYFESEKTIALNWHADIATLFHELRHHVQAAQFAYRSEIQKMLVERRARYAYSGECLPQLNRYFGELDATVEDLAYWQDYFNQLDVPKGAQVSREHPPLHLFQINLSYPFQVSEGVLRDKDCPESFKIATREIWDLLKRNDLSVVAKSLDTTMFVAGGTSGARKQKLVEKAAELRKDIAARLPQVLSERREGIRAVLKKLPSYEYNLWCGYSGAFKLLAGCEEGN